VLRYVQAKLLQIALDIEGMLNPERKLPPEPSRRRGFSSASDGLARLQREAARQHVAPVATCLTTTRHEDPASPAEVAEAAPVDTGPRRVKKGDWRRVAGAAVELFKRLQQEDCLRGRVVPWVRAMARCGGDPQAVSKRGLGQGGGRLVVKDGGGGRGSTIGSGAGSVRGLKRRRPARGQSGGRPSSAPGARGVSIDAGGLLRVRALSDSGMQKRKGGSSGSVMRVEGAGMVEGGGASAGKKARRRSTENTDVVGAAVRQEVVIVDGQARGQCSIYMRKARSSEASERDGGPGSRGMGLLEKAKETGQRHRPGTRECEPSGAGDGLMRCCGAGLVVGTQSCSTKAKTPHTRGQHSAGDGVMRCRGAGIGEEGHEEARAASRRARNRQQRCSDTVSATKGDKCAFIPLY
jgi:hypothetical protein